MAIITRNGKHRVQLFKKGVVVFDKSFGADFAAAKEANEKGKARILLGLPTEETGFEYQELVTASKVLATVDEREPMDQLRDAARSLIPIQKPSGPTFREVIRRYRDEVAAKKDHNVESHRCDAFMKLDIAKKLVTELTRADFQKWQDHRGRQIVKKTGKRVSNTTVNHELSLMARILNVARVDFRVAMPFDHQGWPHNPATIKPLPAVPGRDLRLTSEELDCLFRHLARDPLGEAKMTLPLKLCLEINFRRGELFRMKRADIDFDRKHVLLRAATVKNRRDRLVPLSSRAIAILREAMERIPEDFMGRVFPFNPDSWSRRFYDRRRDAAKECPRIAGFRFHDTRHEAITNMALKIKGEGNLARATGHGSTKHLMRYINPRISDLADMLE